MVEFPPTLTPKMDPCDRLFLPARHGKQARSLPLLQYMKGAPCRDVWLTPFPQSGLGCPNRFVTAAFPAQLWGPEIRRPGAGTPKGRVRRRRVRRRPRSAWRRRARGRHNPRLGKPVFAFGPWVSAILSELKKESRYDIKPVTGIVFETSTRQDFTRPFLFWCPYVPPCCPRSLYMGVGLPSSPPRLDN